MVLGILAHVDAGKTTLSEAMLYTSGQIKSVGRVDHQNAYLDNDAQERQRGITIFSKQARMGDITLLDTPGHVDFSAEMERTLQVLDYAILVISGPDGVQGHTQTLWRLLRRYEIPAFLFVNKMDQPGAERDVILRELKERLDDGITDFSGTDSDDFMEQVALCDEKLLEQYLEEGQISLEKVPELIAGRKIFPCLFGSALKLEGVEAFLNLLKKYMRQPVYREQFGARVFKIMRDEQGNRFTYVKVTGGTLTARMEVEDAARGWQEKVNRIRRYSGIKYEPLTEAPAGMVCALTGLSQTYPGEGLGMEKAGAGPVLEPVLTYRLVLP